MVRVHRRPPLYLGGLIANGPPYGDVHEIQSSETVRKCLCKFSLQNALTSGGHLPKMLSKMAKLRTPITDSVGRPAKAISASNAKSIGQVLDVTEKGRLVAITHYGQVKAVVVPIEQYRQLTDAEPELSELERDFEAMLSRMQATQSREAVNAVFESSPQQMGLAAVAAAAARPRRSRRRSG